MVTVTARYPAAPAVEALKGTLLDAADVQEGIEWLDGAALFESFSQMTFRSVANFCAPNAKTFDESSEWANGFRFAVYGGALCKPVGMDIPAHEAAIRAAFTAGESVGVEQAMMATRFREEAGTEGWPAPTDITPAAAVAPKVGVALLEGWMATRYVGTPTLHMPRSIASLLLSSDGATLDGSVIRTKLGSKVAAGGGYDDPNTSPAGVAAAAGEAWVYITGEAIVRRSAVQLLGATDWENNDQYTLAERGYVVAVDGPVAAVRVTVTA